MKRLALICLALLVVSPAFALQPGGGGIYSGYICFNVTASPSTGPLSNYPILLNVSNATGVSGSVPNTIYTNGTTRPDWKDVNWTDITGNAIRDNWRENNTATSTTAYWWINAPTIATSPGTQACAYFGNSSKTTENAGFDGLNAFPIWDDFLGSSRNASQWNLYGNGGASISGGIITITTSSGSGGMNSTSLFPINYSILFRGALPSGAGSMGLADLPADTNVAATFGVVGYQFATRAGGSYNQSNTNSDTATHLWEIDRNSAFNVSFKYDHTLRFVSGQNFGTVPEYVRFDTPSSASPSMTVDWVVARPYQYPEPTITGFTSIPSGSTPISANFTASPNPQTVNFPVVFTDTSTGTPLTWNWTFGDLDAGNTSTSQNPTRTYKTAGNYTVKLNVSNATGQFSEYSHFQLINPLGVGEVDTFSLIAPSSTARKWTIDPKKMDYSAPSGQAITQINMNVPLGTTGTFTVYQSNGESTSGSYTYTGYPYSTLAVSIGGSSYTEKMTQPVVPMTMKLIISPSIVKNQSTGRALSLAYGWGVGSAAAISHIISQPVEASPIMRFTFNADNDMTATAYTDDYTTSVKNWLQGYSDSTNDLLSSAGNYVEKIKAIAGSAFTIAYGLWYWIDYLFIKNLAMTVSLYISGTMAFAMLSSKNIYSFYKTWFRQQKALYEFIGTAVSTVVSIITMIINAIKPT